MKPISYDTARQFIHTLAEQRNRTKRRTPRRYSAPTKEVVREHITQMREVYTLFQEKTYPHTLDDALNTYTRLREALIDPEIGRLLTEISGAIPFQPGEAIALLGSAANGGAGIRRLTGNYNPGGNFFKFNAEPDIDMVLLAQTTSIDLPRQAKHIATTTLMKPGGFSQDTYYDLSSAPVAIPDTTEGMVLWMKQKDNARKLAFAFCPTFPRIVGEEKRRIAIEALTQLADKEPKQYAKIKETLYFYMQMYTKIQGKYLSDQAMTAKEYQLLNSVSSSLFSAFDDIFSFIPQPHP